MTEPFDQQVGRREWRPQDRWYSVAYHEFRDSREWRYLLALNPSYDIRYHPAPGVPINTRGYAGSDVPNPRTSGKGGVLKNPDLNFGMCCWTTTSNQLTDKRLISLGVLLRVMSIALVTTPQQAC